MQQIINTDALACVYFQTDSPTKTQKNTITAMCRDGRIKNAQKVGRKWFVNTTLEWPRLFPEVEGRGSECS